MDFMSSAAPLTRDAFDNLEAQLGISFPEDYKAFMLENNGGEPEEDWLFDFVDEVTKKQNTSVLRGFYKIYTNDKNVKTYDDLVKICTIMWNERSIGKDTIAIADDPGGNPICMCVEGQHFGKVYYANHEFEDTETGFLFMSEIAPSFTAFIEKLYPDE